MTAKNLAAVFLLLAAGLAFAGDLPDAVATPGAINPDVSQDNVQTTICAHNWTAAIRPTASYTSQLKRAQLAAGPYQSAAEPSAFEEDHLISLELGGHPTDPHNLWPQHWDHPNGAHEKDQLENTLKRMVCAGQITLAQAQQEIASNWLQAYAKYVHKQ